MVRDDISMSVGRPRSSVALAVRSLGTAFDALISALNAVGTVWIFVIMILINADVFARFLFNHPINGVPFDHRAVNRRDCISAACLGIA